MVTKELLAGVEQLREAGATPEDIRSILESREWSREDIEEVLSLTAPQQQNTSPQEENREVSSHDTPPERPEKEEKEDTAEVHISGPGELAHTALSLVREKFWTLIYVIFFSFVLGAAGLYVLQVSMSSLSLSFFDQTLTDLLSGGLAEASVASLLTGGILIFILMGVAAILTMWMPASLIGVLGFSKGLGAGLRHGFVRQGSLFFTMLLCLFFVVVGGVLFLIPGIIAAIWFGFAPLCAVLERKAGISALAKSQHYVHSHLWSVVTRQIFLLVPIVFLLVFVLLVAFPFLYVGDTSTLSVPESLYLIFAIVTLFTAGLFFALFILGYEIALYRSLKKHATASQERVDRVANALTVITLCVVALAVGGVQWTPGIVEQALNTLPWIENVSL